MAKRVDPLKAKQAKQKKIAIGLSLMLVLVLAYQGPKTLKMLKGPQPVAAPAADPVTTPPPTPATGGVPAPVVAAPTDSPQPAVLADSDTPVGAGRGQLLSFEQFSSSDPFKQQVDMKAGAAVDPDDDPSAGTEPVSPGVDPTIPGSAENPPLSVGGGSGTSRSAPGNAGSSGSGSSGVVPGAPAAATETTISVNGIVQTIVAGTPFPVEDPTFELLSLGPDGKSVQIGVAGGSLAGGGAAVKLVIGKPLTLQNTADGSRYKLVLLTVEGAAPPTG
jgi:hypothetical protein